MKMLFWITGSRLSLPGNRLKQDSFLQDPCFENRIHLYFKAILILNTRIDSADTRYSKERIFFNILNFNRILLAQTIILRHVSSITLVPFF